MLKVVERVRVDVCSQIATANGFAARRVQIAHAHVKLAIVRIDLRGVCHGLVQTEVGLSIICQLSLVIYQLSFFLGPN
jgi:hypothetical protein